MPRKRELDVHFLGAPTGNRAAHQNIAQVLQSQGHTLITSAYLENTHAAAELLEHDRDWIQQAEVVIIEISENDINIGYQVRVAVSLQKPVLLLYHRRDGHRFHQAANLHSHAVQVLGYTERTLGTVLRHGLAYAAQDATVRFNIILPSRLNAYLNWIAAEQHIPKSVFVRRLIHKHMQQNVSYKRGIS